MAGPDPEEVVRILRTAASSRHDPRLDEVLSAYRRQWLAIARRVYPELVDDFDDAVQQASIDLLKPEVLDGLADVRNVHAWARGLFLNKLKTMARDRGRTLRRRQPVPDHVATLLEWLEELAAEEPTPEELVSDRQRLAIVLRLIEEMPIARAKFLEDVPDKELAARFGKTHDAIRNYLKRVRHLLRAAVTERS
jgi:RNA polymerase sigma factor (sigma-70 family)